MYPHTDNIKNIVKDKSDLVQRHGLNYLIPKWQRFAYQYADREETIYEWLNDLDGRKIIDEILALLQEKERHKIEEELMPIDDQVVAKTFEVNECIWGEEAEITNNYNRQEHWYYYQMNNHIFEGENGRFTRKL